MRTRRRAGRLAWSSSFVVGIDLEARLVQGRRRPRRPVRRARRREPRGATARRPGRRRDRASWDRPGSGRRRRSDLDEEVGIADAGVRPRARPVDRRDLRPRADRGIDRGEVVPAEHAGALADGEDVREERRVGRMRREFRGEVRAPIALEMSREVLLVAERVPAPEDVVVETGLGKAGQRRALGEAPLEVCESEARRRRRRAPEARPLRPASRRGSIRAGGRRR